MFRLVCGTGGGGGGGRPFCVEGVRAVHVWLIRSYIVLSYYRTEKRKDKEKESVTCLSLYESRKI